MNSVVDFLVNFQSNVILFHSIRAFILSIRTRFLLKSRPRTYFFTLLTFLFLSFGGSLIANILQGNPQSWLFSSELIPIYLFWHGLVFYAAGMDRLVSFCHATLDPYMNLYLQFARGFSLAQGVYAFRHHSTLSTMAKASWSGQIIIGMLSSSGSGIIYRWVCSSITSLDKKTKNAVQLAYPGRDFTIALGCCFLNLFLNHVHLFVPLIQSYLPSFYLWELEMMTRNQITVACALFMMLFHLF